MKIVLQRVLEADVAVDGQIVGQINRGLLVFLGVAAGDTETKAEALADKIARLRIFPDENGKSNLSVSDIGGEILVISQFTLCADTKKGNRPSFIDAAPPELGNELYEHFVQCCRSNPGFAKVAAGIFGADMKVRLINDGPYTIVVEI
ncbi:MAG: D-aminoacyl-tRNA deacylase [Defluviitaleaceae bacterium]|nr:D-aminoacyl-tRNA deacylase [Defluviitaleaceae bacterium]